VKRRTSNIF